MEKTSFCEVGCGSELFSGCFWTIFSAESAAEYAQDCDFFHENLLEKTKSKESKI